MRRLLVRVKRVWGSKELLIIRNKVWKIHEIKNRNQKWVNRMFEIAFGGDNVNQGACSVSEPFCAMHYINEGLYIHDDDAAEEERDWGRGFETCRVFTRRIRDDPYAFPSSQSLDSWKFWKINYCWKLYCNCVQFLVLHARNLKVNDNLQLSFQMVSLCTGSVLTKVYWERSPLKMGKITKSCCSSLEFWFERIE